jgi:hypothetical protein
VEKTMRAGMYALQLALLVVSVGSAVVFAVWILSYNGFGLVQGGWLPDALASSDVNAVPYEPVLVQGDIGVATAAAAQDAIGGGLVGIAPPGASEFYGNTAFLSFWSMTFAQHLAWTAVRALPMLGMAVIFWLMFTLVRDVRNGKAFTRKVAGYLGIIGVIAVLGSPLLQVARWLVARWLVETSTAADIAAATPLSLAVWPIVLGLVVLVAGFAWREAVVIKEDMEGVV